MSIAFSELPVGATFKLVSESVDKNIYAKVEEFCLGGRVVNAYFNFIQRGQSRKWFVSVRDAQMCTTLEPIT